MEGNSIQIEIPFSGQNELIVAWLTVILSSTLGADHRHAGDAGWRAMLWRYSGLVKRDHRKLVPGHLTKILASHRGRICSLPVNQK